jgi:hypothetical protein
VRGRVVSRLSQALARIMGRMRSDDQTNLLSTRAAILALSVVAAALGACGSGAASSSSADTDTACSAEVRLGLFASDTCDGEPVLVVTLPLDQPCVGWDRGVRYNSATRLQCYRDRLCYTQYVASPTCDAAEATLVEDKESRTTCTDDPTPNIWTRILSGTEDCPEAPEGFTCPVSGPDGGNTEVAACS